MRDTMDDPATRAGLLGVFASHVLPRLDIQDLRALGQCCTELRHLVHRDLPFSTWRTLATKSFPTAYPVLLTDTTSTRARVPQLAPARRAALIPDQLTAEASFSIWPPDRLNSRVNAPTVANHAGTQLIALQAGKLELWDLDAVSHTVLRSWTRSSPENMDAQALESADCCLSWSSDDQLVSLAFTICNYEDERAHFNKSGWFSAVYVLQLADKSLHKVSETAENAMLRPVKFCAGSNVLLIPWDIMEDDACHIDVYSQDGLAKIARISDSDLKVEARLAFAQHGQLIAIGHATHVCVYGLDGQLCYKVEAGGDAEQQFYDVAWSPAGDVIFLWQGSTLPATLNVFDCASQALLISHLVPGLPDTYAPDMPKLLLLAISLSAATTVQSQTSCFSELLAHAQLPRLQGEPFGQQLAAYQKLTAAAFSPDGTFLAYIAPVDIEGRHVPALHILDTQQGSLLLTYQPENWQSLDVLADIGGPFFSLTWSASGSFVMASTYLSSHDQVNREWRTVSD